MRPAADPVRPGQESVWSFPRPAIVEPCRRLLEVVHRGLTVASTRRGLRTLETSHPPSYYFPPADVAMHLLRPSPGRSVCEWKGEAAYLDLVVESVVLTRVAWSYPAPTPGFAALRGHVAFYPGPLDGCFVDGERATPQAGGFYGGWITSHVAGPFKGGPGSQWW